MITPPSSSGGQPGNAGGPSGLVTVIVGDVSRSSSSRSRSRQGANRAQTRKAAGAEAGPGIAESTGPGDKGVAQWSFRWATAGPGPLLPGCDGEPDLTLTISTEDARRVKDGELAPSVAFMQGKLKSSGDNAVLLRILAWSATPEFAKVLADWADETPARPR